MCLHRREQVTSLQIQMDRSEDWKLQQDQGGEKSQKYHHHFLPKRILKFVFSVSVFSFLLWYSFGCSILPHEESINAFFSTFIFSIFSHILQRKYMFLICNAILAFLAKTSLSMSDSYDEDLHDHVEFPHQSENAIPVSVEASSSIMADQQQQETDNKEVVSEEADDDEEAEEEEEEEEAFTVKKEADSTNKVMVGTQDGGEEEEEETMGGENEELSNADELNRKFEEFIRKMKEEIRIEAQSQLIAV
ncbi:hypothetical protein QN277_005499 [Acacia crassicarpa]|uniref:Uncharacterized protein n=1 Tax=Acacia crassicarpa TaxID=499986 RepID=A0AAE1M9U8_9FABA|nr:hypothetical protein QN277_005499 [Acacia crassicarpa]